jgi:gliding motility-associated-like protein
MTQRLFYKIFFIFIINLFSISYSHATHIIGGELTYSCLGNNRYEISLTVYRDCYTGVPPFDSPAYIGIFGGDFSIIDTLRMTRRDTLKLDPVLNDTCLVVPPNVCVSTTTYKDTITLLPRPGGYILAYQRCCRNQSILNIVKPLDSGATFSVEITEDALMKCNSSAKFKEWPPIYICVNRPIYFDQSAIDIDGDSIFYSLCTPLLGGTNTQPQPRPAFPPPYDNVIWKAPYGLNNILGGDPLKIDPKTGLLTGMPNTIGQFVVGICLEEFRNGKLLSTTRRDFQFNVGVCGSSVASIFAPKIVCDDFTVFFENKSLNSNKYDWDFGDPNTDLDVSTDKEPAYAYPDTGTYTIRLITQPKSACADTSYHTVTLKQSSIVPNFIWEEKSCEDSLVIQFTNKSTDTLGKKIAGYRWLVFYGFDDTLRSTMKDPTFVLKRSGAWTARLTIIAENGCEKTIEKDFSANLIDFTIPDTVRACVGEIVQLNPTSDPSLTYDWSPAAAFSNPKSAKQEATVTEQPQQFSVLLGNGTCTRRRTVYVLKDNNAPDVKAFAKPDTITLGKVTQLDATTFPTTYKYTWTPSNTLSNNKIANPFASPTVTTTYIVEVKAPNSKCVGTAQARVVVVIPECDEPNIFLPNAFTPDDDGVNDILQVRGAIISQVKLLIYNRWGEKIFESEEVGGGWDGYYNGLPCAPDVYGYYLEVVCFSGKKLIKKGNINLIR